MPGFHTGVDLKYFYIHSETFRTPADSGSHDFTAFRIYRYELDIVLFKNFSQPIARLRGQRLFLQFKVAERLLRHA